MGNLHETLKGQTNFGTNDKEIQDMMKNKTSDIFSELDNPEYFKVPENTILGQLFSWSLPEVKVVYDKYRRYTYFPLMDRTMFCKVMPFSKRNSSYLFEILTKQGNPQYLPFFELLCILILTAYSNSRNKLKMLFNIFDIVGNGSLAFPQWHIFVISFIQAYCRLVDKPFPKRSKLERVAKLIFVKIDVAPYNNALDHTEILDWVEGTPNLVGLLTRFESSFTIREKPTIFFSNKRYNDKQIDEITTALLNYGTTGEESAAKIQEMIQKSARPDVYHKPKIYQDSRNSLESRQSSVDSDKGTSPVKGNNPRSSSSNFKFEFLTETKSPKTSKFKVRKATFADSKDETKTFGNTAQSPVSARNLHHSVKTPKTAQQLMSKTVTLPTIKPYKGMYNPELVQKRKELMAKSRALVKRNVIITSGRSFTRSDILNLRYYFNAIADGDDVMTLKDFVRSFAKNASLQKVSASLFNFLDDKGKGYITFPELVKKLYPGMKSDQLKLALEWAMEEENLEKTQGQRKYLEEANKQKKGATSADKLKKNPVPKEGIKKLKYMFDMYDDEHKGWVSLDNLKAHLGSIYSNQELEETFKDLDKDLDGKLNLKEFIDMILPADFYIEAKLLNDPKLL